MPSTTPNHTTDKKSSENLLLYKGVVVWAKVYGYPWWPASITTDQRSGKWFHKGKYWVYFFNDPQGAWLKPNCLKEFNEENIAALTPKENHRYYKQIIKAVEEAREVQSNAMPPEEIAALAQAQESTEDNAANATTEEEATEDEMEISDASQERSLPHSKNNSQQSTPSLKRKRESSRKRNDKSVRNSQASRKDPSQKRSRYREVVFQMPIDRPYHELDPSQLENPQSMDITEEELVTRVEQLQQLGDLFCSKENEIKGIQDSLRELTEEINEKIRLLEKHFDEVYSIEGQVLQSLKSLFQSRVTIPMLKNSRAGKPLVQLEKSCGPNSNAIRSMAKQLVRQWKKMIMDTTPSKKNEETSQIQETKEEEYPQENNSEKEDFAEPSDGTKDANASLEIENEKPAIQFSVQDENGKNCSEETENSHNVNVAPK